MCDPVRSGVPGSTLEPGDHVCALYLGHEERDQIVVPYLQEGLRAGHRCVAVVDSSPPDELVASVDADGLGPARLDVLTADETYLRAGAFRSDAMLAFWAEYLAEAPAQDDIDIFRACGEMSWSLRDPSGIDELVRYEAAINELPGRHSACLLCLYDLRLFGGRILMELLRTHPKVLFGGVLLRNPLYVRPDEIPAAPL